MNKKPLIGITTGYDREHKEMNIRTTYTEAVMHGGGIPVLNVLQKSELEDVCIPTSMASRSSITAAT